MRYSSKGLNSSGLGGFRGRLASWNSKSRMTFALGFSWVSFTGEILWDLLYSSNQCVWRVLFFPSLGKNKCSPPLLLCGVSWSTDKLITSLCVFPLAEDGLQLLLLLLLHLKSWLEVCTTAGTPSLWLTCLLLTAVFRFSFNFRFSFKITFIYWVWAFVSVCMCGGQRTTCDSWFAPSTVWLPGIETRSQVVSLVTVTHSPPSPHPVLSFLLLWCISLLFKSTSIKYDPPKKFSFISF